MATYDDRQWMLTLIQNAYVTTDDTGLCEIIIEGDGGMKSVAEFPFFNSCETVINENDEPRPASPDISTDSKLSNHRHRSYTERKSERLRREKENSRVKKIHWKSRKDWTDSELSEMFQRKVLVDEINGTEQTPRFTSMLTHLIENSQQDTQINSFIEYSKFDGTTDNNVPRKQISIYLYVGKNPSLDYPLSVSVINSAKVVELIGLICWLYTKDKRQPPIKTIDRYQLYMAEEDGQCFWEFQPLEKRHKIEHYGFPTLALVENEAPESNKRLEVTVNFARGQFSRIEIENTEVTLKEILAKSIRLRKEIVRMKEVGMDYHLEKEHEPGTILDMDKTLADVQCFEFAAVRDNSKRINGREIIKSCNQIEASVQQQSFVVVWEKKFSKKFDTKIEISVDKIEITPVASPRGNSLLGGRLPPPYKYRLDQLIDCDRKQLKRNKSEIVITIQGEHRFKDFKFICDEVVSQELYDKCRALIKRKGKRLSSNYRRHNSLSSRVAKSSRPSDSSNSLVSPF